MQTIGEHELWSFFDFSRKSKRARNNEIRKAPGHPVKSYLELATKVAELQFRNRDHVLLFRGQGGDHRNRNNHTTLKPSLFRSLKDANVNPSSAEIIARFEQLRKAEEKLVSKYVRDGFLGKTRLRKHQAVRWSILQHYEVCPTPLLDVTHSLRIACSFASLRSKSEAFIFVLGVPNLSGAITASAEAALQINRLSSVCPPSAVRPHIQEGYLLGEYPELTDPKQKGLYQDHEIDFGRRLVAKFLVNPKTFWTNDAFPRVEEIALYPDEGDDPLYRLALEVKGEL